MSFRCSKLVSSKVNGLGKEKIEEIFILKGETNLRDLCPERRFEYRTNRNGHVCV